jgi:hypothetical protein
LTGRAAQRSAPASNARLPPTLATLRIHVVTSRSQTEAGIPTKHGSKGMIELIIDWKQAKCMAIAPGEEVDR